MTGVHPGVLIPSEHHSPVRLFLVRVRGLDHVWFVLLAGGQGTGRRSVDLLGHLFRVHHHQQGDRVVFSVDSRGIIRRTVHHCQVSHSMGNRVVLIRPGRLLPSHSSIRGHLHYQLHHLQGHPLLGLDLLHRGLGDSRVRGRHRAGSSQLPLQLLHRIRQSSEVHS